MQAAAPSSPVAGTRPRVEGAREKEIYAAALDVLTEQGYDKLTLDTVAARAKASKATLYRRWSSKADLVADAMVSLNGETPQLPDTGSLRDDLLAMAAGHEGLLDPERTSLLCGISTAMGRDAGLAQALRERFINPRRACMTQVLERARSRGEIEPEVDLDLIGSIVPAMLVFQVTFNELTGTAEHLVRQIIDQIMLPALHCRSD